MGGGRQQRTTIKMRGKGEGNNLHQLRDGPVDPMGGKEITMDCGQRG